MILVTGTRGFVGQSLVPLLIEHGHVVRSLSQSMLEHEYRDNVAQKDLMVVNMEDPSAIRQAMVGVDTIVHLASAQCYGGWKQLMEVDYRGTRQLLTAAKEMGVRRFVYPSHLGSGRSSAYPILKTKGVVEEFVRKSGVPFTIIRSAAIFGPNDQFTNTLALLMKSIPAIFPRPGSGNSVRQPIWIGDYADCVTRLISDNRFANETIDIGGPEFLTVDRMLKSIMEVVGIRRLLISVPVVQMRWIVFVLRKVLRTSSITSNWIDYVSRDCNCEINSVQRYFGIRPIQFDQSIGYLANK
ncbi:MAG: NAD-dependent epimerase/dehydratase family protein [Anaerolineales bacterium]|nr:NAD-dependent epimerase/dehydratase family protein [Anaerolineales bacterium]